MILPSRGVRGIRRADQKKRDSPLRAAERSACEPTATSVRGTAAVPRTASHRRSSFRRVCTAFRRSARNLCDLRRIPARVAGVNVMRKRQTSPMSAVRGSHETDRNIAAQSDSGRRDRIDGLRVRPAQPARAAAAIVPRHRAAADLHLYGLACRLAGGGRIRTAGAAGAGIAGIARTGGTRRQRQHRRQRHQPDLRDRHGHEECPGRSARPSQPAAAAAARRGPSGRAARRRRLQSVADLVFRAAAAWNEGSDSRLPRVHRHDGEAAHRGGTWCRRRQRQRGAARRGAHHGRSGQGRGHGHSDH